jgi:hypothetical protein
MRCPPVRTVQNAKLFGSRAGLYHMFKTVRHALGFAFPGNQKFYRPARAGIFRASRQIAVVLINPPPNIRGHTAVICSVSALQKIDVPSIHGNLARHSESFYL